VKGAGVMMKIEILSLCVGNNLKKHQWERGSGINQGTLKMQPGSVQLSWSSHLRAMVS
jgi:hypothetical protein